MAKRTSKEAQKVTGRGTVKEAQKGTGKGTEVGSEEGRDVEGEEGTEVGTEEGRDVSVDALALALLRFFDSSRDLFNSVTDFTYDGT